MVKATIYRDGNMTSAWRHW